MEFPCELCLTRTPCKNNSRLTHRSIDYQLIDIIDKCPELKKYIFPEGEFSVTRYHQLETFMRDKGVT